MLLVVATLLGCVRSPESSPAAASTKVSTPDESIAKETREDEASSCQEVWEKVGSFHQFGPELPCGIGNEYKVPPLELSVVDCELDDGEVSVRFELRRTPGSALHVFDDRDIQGGVWEGSYSLGGSRKHEGEGIGTLGFGAGVSTGWKGPPLGPKLVRDEPFQASLKIIEESARKPTEWTMTIGYFAARRYEPSVRDPKTYDHWGSYESSRGFSLELADGKCSLAEKGSPAADALEFRVVSCAQDPSHVILGMKNVADKPIYFLQGMDMSEPDGWMSAVHFKGPPMSNTEPGTHELGPVTTNSNASWTMSYGSSVCTAQSGCTDLLALAPGVELQRRIDLDQNVVQQPEVRVETAFGISFDEEIPSLKMREWKTEMVVEDGACRGREP